ncbi:putative acetyl-CoA acetyltransferase, cytosolic 2-like [Capsicum annuum]|uniref:U-box domain-containing protein 35-like n=1 Tax=Capsicum annuum TaxID=4072 RepID=A0A1U8EFA2_CAPAN|nr:uncharacterized protein LOC107845322 [Capsicum annuum]KAF3644567.1 putative acetyl-CoA acetyltransferase, cytosolic 2-like [Capsicum annuum]KAF3661503.1 putative acetyl-CoA acetyltransferase, cytosolic 2-like [Capsicum annuum]PHT95362.1 hypothetical protein T459_03244 [Capsicum annuum]
MMKSGEVYCYTTNGSNDILERGSSNSSSLGNEIEEIEEDHYVPASEVLEINNDGNRGGGGLATIKEGHEVEGSLYSFDFHNNGNAVVYVAVGNSSSGNKISKESSMDALVWTLKHAVVDPSNTIVFLIHIYPETKSIPTPLGLIPVGQVSAEQKENHMAQERGKRRHFLQKFFDACSATTVKVDTILIESDTEAKAILDLIPICNIRRLILGTSKANLKKLKSKKGGGTADQILLNAPEFCEVKIICEGKEMVELQTFESPSPQATTVNSPKRIQSHSQVQDQAQNGSFGCGCFKARVMPKIFNNLH